jgi:integrase
MGVRCLGLSHGWAKRGRRSKNGANAPEFVTVRSAPCLELAATPRRAGRLPLRLPRWRRYLALRAVVPAPRTVEKARMVLGGVFEHARDAFGFEVNPVRAVKPPKQRKQAPLDFYSVADVKALVRAAESKQDGAIFLTAALTGLRRGELVALRVGNVDNEGAVIRVEGSYGHGEASSTKSGEVRAVPMALEVAKALANLFTQRSNERGKPVDPHRRDGVALLGGTTTRSLDG